MLATHVLCLSFVVTTELATHLSLPRAAVHGVLWNVTDAYPSHASKSCYALNRTHWAFAQRCVCGGQLLERGLARLTLL